MLRDYVVNAGLSLALTSLLLFLVGERWRYRHWGWSQLTILVTAVAAWVLQRTLTGDAPSFVLSIAAALAVGTVITALSEDWTAVAHANFTAVVLTVATFLTYAAYVLVEANLGPVSFAFGVVLFVLQIAVLVLLVAHTFEILDVACRRRWRRQFESKTVPGYWPKVSIHVPTHNEPPDLVIETLDALARLDYPNYEVLVIDNNTHDEALWRPVEQHCAALGAAFRFFHLDPWPGFKSGALNYALDQVAPDTEIVGIVDADYVVQPDYLRDLVGHFSDPQVAFVQTPQDYRDGAARGRYGRALYLSYRYFFSVSMVSRNERNAIIFAGTMGLIRRHMLEAVGRWDEWCITEDAELSLRLLKAGYQSVYIDRSYGRGLMPPDFAALKRQRFRWAFGGMQLLRMHARAVFSSRAAGHLTVAQRLAYISGGLQWLNDPMTVVFTMIMLIAASALIVGGSLYLQPLVAGTVLVPPLLVWFGVMRFLWAFRVRVRCTWTEAIDSFIMLLGLTWVVTLACIRGLTASRGVFLRTPKQSERPRVIDTIRVVWLEIIVSALCLLAGVAVLIRQPFPVLSARTTFLALLLWQFVIYASAARSSVWSYQAYTASPSLRRRIRLASTMRLLPVISEWRVAGWVGASALGLGVLFWVAVILAPGLERVFRVDPLDTFIPAHTLLPSSRESTVTTQLIREADAARRQDLSAALALWEPTGVIRDEMFTPDRADDDRVWSGSDGLRRRYQLEFSLRRYHRLRHRNLTVTFHGDDEATIVNDLDAVIEGTPEPAYVELPRSDRWTLRRRNGQWRIAMLEVNRAVVSSAHQNGLVATTGHIQ